MLTVYSTPVSSNGRKVLAAIDHLGLEHDYREVDVYAGDGRAPEYLALNPFGKVPTLVDGDFVLYESNAILQYLSEVHGDHRLFSPDPGVRADIGRWLFWEAAHWQPAWTVVMTPLAGHKLRPDLFPPPEAAPDWEHSKLAPLLAFVEGWVQRRTWLVDERLTLADLSVGAMMTYAHVGGFPFTRYPALAAWYKRVEQLPAWRATRCPLWESEDDPAPGGR